MAKTTRQKTPARPAAPAKAIRTVKDLVQDPRNANKGTARGAAMLERSVRAHGTGRSVLVDKNGLLIAGNKATLAAASAGVTDVVVVPTTGKTLVVHQRTDLDLSRDAAAKELAVYDNRTSEVGLAWDGGTLDSLKQDGVDMDQLFREGEWATLVEALKDEGAVDEIPEMALQPFEQYDYLLIVFKNSQDWQGACDELGIRREAVTLGKTRKIGLGRVLDGRAFMERLKS